MSLLRNVTEADSLEGPKHTKTNMRLGAWSVRILHGEVSLTAAAREIARCKLHLVEVHKLKLDRGGNISAEN
jgi:hypothetical protein